MDGKKRGRDVQKNYLLGNILFVDEFLLRHAELGPGR
jgi:hypothetical protein